jgi:hypothetical protein
LQSILYTVKVRGDQARTVRGGIMKLNRIEKQVLAGCVFCAATVLAGAVSWLALGPIHFDQHKNTIRFVRAEADSWDVIILVGLYGNVLVTMVLGIYFYDLRRKK